MLIKINGHLQRFSDRIVSLKRVRRSEYRLETTIGTYRIEGGRHAGGSRRDWFLEPIGDSPIFRSSSKAIHCTSVVDAIKLVASA